MTRPVTDTCWKKTYLMPSASIRRVISSIRSRRPGWLRASSKVVGAGAMRVDPSTVWTVPPKVCATPGRVTTLPSPSTIVISVGSPLFEPKVGGERNCCGPICIDWGRPATPLHHRPQESTDAQLPSVLGPGPRRRGGSPWPVDGLAPRQERPAGARRRQDRRGPGGGRHRPRRGPQQLLSTRGEGGGGSLRPGLGGPSRRPP